MLEHAAAKHVPGELLAGDACSLPIGNETFDGVSVGWGLREQSPTLMPRVREASGFSSLGGRFACLDMAQPKGLVGRVLCRFIDGRILPHLGSPATASRTPIPIYLRAQNASPPAKRLPPRWPPSASPGFASVTFAFGHVCLHIARKPQ